MRVKYLNILSIDIVAAAAALLLSLVFVVPALAAVPFEQTGCFAGKEGNAIEACKIISKEFPQEAELPEDVQLGGIGQMAVNYTGNGGVPAGTVYTAREGTGGLPNTTGMWVSMYYPDLSGKGLKFEESWKVPEGGGPYTRCGPLLGVDEKGNALTPCGARPAGPEVAGVGIGVDQTTGNVYFLETNSAAVGRKPVVEYEPKGEAEITRFGEESVGGESIEQSPEKFHARSALSASLAVTATGRVYVFDQITGGGYHRLAVFEPEHAGDYSSYAYVGEIAGGIGGSLPTGPVVDSAGDVYVGGGDPEESPKIVEYGPEKPSAFPHPSTPICTFEYASGGIAGMTVNPENGEVFFYAQKPAKKAAIHRLAPCKDGVFQELETIGASPKPGSLFGLAFDPDRQLDPAHSAGVLYGGSYGGSAEGGSTSLGYIFARPGERTPPLVETESSSNITGATGRLAGSVNPNGHVSDYAFQYLQESAYIANQPDERQSVTVKASAGIFGLSFEGQNIGGEIKATLSAGSREATGLVTAEGTAATTAGSKSLTGVLTSFGHFEVGQPVVGSGIPGGSKVVAIEGANLTLSQAATATGAGVAVTSSGPGPAQTGLVLEGPGVAVGTAITAVESGKMRLSQGASTQGVVTLRVGLPFDATAGRVRRALEGLGVIGDRNVTVAGGPGDASGSTSYEVSFTRELGNANVPQLEVDGTGLGGGGSATANTLHEGGGGFAGPALQEVGGGLAGSGPNAVAANLTGLAPDTSYRYRLIAKSNCNPSEPDEVCEADGVAHEIHTYPVSGQALPAGRAWELVSPVDKAGGQVLPAEPLLSSCPPGERCKPGSTLEHFPMQSTPNGEEIAFEGTPFGGSGGASRENQYIASRNPELGWNTQNPSPPTMTGPAGQGYKFVSETLGLGVVKQNSVTLAPDAPPGYANLYVQSLTDPSYIRPLITTGVALHRPPSGAGEFEINFAGASADGSRLYFTANDALTEATEYAPKAEDPAGPSKFNLYEWHEGDLALVNVAPNNATSEPGAKFGTISAHPISADGSHAFFENEAGHLFVRIDGRETRRIEDPGHFLLASADGNQVLLSDGCLYTIVGKTSDKSENCTNLTQGKGGLDGVVGESKDLSHIYFVDSEVLTGEEENEAGEVAAEGAHNLYSWSLSSGTHFVARLQSNDNTNEPAAGIKGLVDWQPVPSERTAEASPDGRYVAFLSYSQLTGYDNIGPCSSDTSPGPCPEAFVYDSATGELTCASCDSTNSQPLGRTVLRRIYAGENLPQPRYLTNSGRLFFDTQNSLAQSDTNGGAEDVYEWAPHGVSGCARSAGCVGLLSGGREGSDSNFLAMDEGGGGREAGSDVFFTTRQHLLPADTDSLVDLYDAREGGGLAFETELSPSPECQGDACQRFPPAVILPAPASLTFSASGNLAALQTLSTFSALENHAASKKCPANKARHGDRCVKKKSAHKGRKQKRRGARVRSTGKKRASSGVHKRGAGR